MSVELNGRGDGDGVERFERNRYFHGKLMTARDMEAEQTYHASRLHTVARHVLGQGVVCGLRAAVESDDGGTESDEVTVRVDPGVALDCWGRPVVVRDPVRTSHRPAGEELYVYLAQRECDKESVPVDCAGDVSEEECEYNRVLELAEVEVLDEPKEDAAHGTVATVELPAGPAGGPESPGEDAPDSDTDAEPVEEMDGRSRATDLSALARSYYDAAGECATCEGSERSVFVGTLTLTGESWAFTRGSLVYKNDLLYAAIARHAADFANPHEVALSLEQSDDPAGAVVSVDGLEDRERDLLLVSENDRLRIEADEDGKRVVFTMTGDGGGGDEPAGLQSINGQEGADGNVEFVSPQGTISIEAEGNEIRLDIAGEPPEIPERPERPELDVFVDRRDELLELLERQTDIRDLLDRRDEIDDLADNRALIAELADHREDFQVLFDNRDDIEALVNRRSDIETLADSRSDIETLVSRSDDIEMLVDNRDTLETLVNRGDDIAILAERRNDLTNLLDR